MHLLDNYTKIATYYVDQHSFIDSFLILMGLMFVVYLLIKLIYFAKEDIKQTKDRKAQSEYMKRLKSGEIPDYDPSVENKTLLCCSLQKETVIKLHEFQSATGEKGDDIIEAALLRYIE